MDIEERLAQFDRRLRRLEARLGLRSPADIVAPRPAEVPSAASMRTVEAAPALLPPIAAPAATLAAPPAAQDRGPEPTAPPALAAPEGPPVLRESPLPRPTAPAPATDWERFFGVAVLGRVGIGALLLAAAYFAQLAYRVMDPTLRVLSIYGLAGLLVGAGFLLRSRTAPRYVALLWGGGVAAAYLAGATARLRYGIVGPVPATVLLIGACALGQALARIARLPALAHVALAGALSAPVLVGGPQDARTSLLVYLLAVHAWAAFTESRWGWRGARILAAVGATAVGLLWLSAHGRPDLSTVAHLQGYLFGLTWPEWAGTLRGRSFPRLRIAIVLSLAGLGEVLASAPAFAREALRLVPLAAGAAWFGLGVLARVRRGPADGGVRGLLRLGSLVLLVGAMAAWAHMGTSWLSTEQGVTLSLAALGTAFVLLRPALGTGDETGTLAAALGIPWLLPVASRDPVALAALATPLALVLTGGRSWSRIAGLGLGILALFAGLGNTQEPWLRALAYAGSAALAIVAHARGDGGRDRALASASELALSVLVAVLTADATTGVLAPVLVPFANPGTAAALALAAALAWASRPGAQRHPEVPVWIARGALAALVVLAGWRETEHLVRPLADAGMRRMLEVAYLAAASGAFLAIGRAVRSLRATGAGFLLLGIGALLAAEGAVAPGGGWTAAAQVGLILVPALTSLRGREGQPSWVSGIACGFTLAAAGLWTLFLSQGRWDGEVLLGNPRFLAGLAATAAIVAARRAPALAGASPWGGAFAWAAALLGYATGLMEVRDAVAPLESFQWRAALVSVYTTLYSAGLLAVGFRTGSRHLRTLALLGFGTAVVKVGLHDLAALDTPYRILITGCLGVVLLLAAYAYARRERSSGGPADPGDRHPPTPEA